MSHKSPAFQIYVNDFLGSAKVGMMSGQEIGVYTMLLFLDWQENGFVLVPEPLSRWCRVSLEDFNKAWELVGQCFKQRRGRMYNPRLELERQKQAAWREKSVKGGLASVEARGKGGSKKVQPKHQPEGNTPLPLPSPSPVTTKTTKAGSGERPLKSSRLSQSDTELLRESWRAAIGALPFSRFRKAMLPIFDVPDSSRPPVTDIQDAIIAYGEWFREQDDREQGFQSVEKFVQQVTKWIRLGKMPIAESGVMTERGSWAGTKEIRAQQRVSA